MTTFSGPPPLGISTDLQNSMNYEMCLLCSSDNWPCKADALKISWGGVDGHRKVPKAVHFWGLRGLVLGAILQNFITLSIQRVKSSFFVQIEAEVKGISHKKLISKIDLFESTLLVSKSGLKKKIHVSVLKARYIRQGWGGVNFVKS